MPGVTRHRLFATSIAVVMAVLCAAAQSRPPQNQRLDRLKEWLSLVAQHQPGRVDEAVQVLRLWTHQSLQDVRDDLYASDD